MGIYSDVREKAAINETKLKVERLVLEMKEAHTKLNSIAKQIRDLHEIVKTRIKPIGRL